VPSRFMVSAITLNVAILSRFMEKCHMVTDGTVQIVGFANGFATFRFVKLHAF